MAALGSRLVVYEEIVREKRTWPKVFYGALLAGAIAFVTVAIASDWGVNAEDYAKPVLTSVLGVPFLGIPTYLLLLAYGGIVTRVTKTELQVQYPWWPRYRAVPLCEIERALIVSSGACRSSTEIDPSRCRMCSPSPLFATRGLLVVLRNRRQLLVASDNPGRLREIMRREGAMADPTRQ